MKRIGFISLLVCALTACHVTQPEIAPPPVDHQKSAAILVTLGVGYLQEGNIERAQHKLDKALKEAPNYAPAYSAKGYFFERTGHPEKAEYYYKRALVLSPRAGEAQNNYGTFLCRQKRYREALTHFMAAVSDTHYFLSGDAYENAGLCALDIPDKKLAREYLKKALQHDPRRARVILVLAELAYAEQQYPQAKEYMAHYAQLNRWTPDARQFQKKLTRTLENTSAAAHDRFSQGGL